jgi:hypothetical protein
MVLLDEERGRREETLTRLQEQFGDQLTGLLRTGEQMSRQELASLALAQPSPEAGGT